MTALCHSSTPITCGFLLGEIIRRVDGRRPAQFFADEIATPARINFQIALRATADLPRVAVLKIPPRDLPDAGR